MSNTGEVRVAYTGKALGPRRYHEKGAKSFYWFGPSRHAESLVNAADLDWLLSRREFGNIVFAVVDDVQAGQTEEPQAGQTEEPQAGQTEEPQDVQPKKPTTRSSRRKKKPEAEVTE